MTSTVTAEGLRKLALLVERGAVDVIRCDLKPRGVVLGVVAPDRARTTTEQTEKERDE